MANVSENQHFSDIAATPAPFTLLGGMYGMSVVGSISTSVSLFILGPDHTTYVDTGMDATAAGYFTGYLPPGTYELQIVSATGVYVDITRIPS